MTERHLKSLLGLEPSKWMMAPSERLAVLGLLQTIMPKKALEFGCADAGLTAWLSQYSDEVVTVDIDPKVLVLAQPFHNVTPLCMTTQEPADWAWSEGKHFDLAVIDADHSEAGVRRDLKNAMRFCDVIVFHDTYYPPCRKGILSALVGQDVYVDLDLIPGGMQPDGLWGGLGIVITDLPRIIDMHVMLRLSLYPWLRKLWLLDQYRHQVEHLARVFRLKIRQLMRRGKAISRRED